MLKAIVSKASTLSFEIWRTGDNRTTIQLSLLWFACFAFSDPIESIYFLAASGLMAVANIYVVLKKDSFSDFQTILFRVSMLTGWVLLASLIVGFAVDVPTGLED